MASLSAPGVPAITYNPDTAGRIGSISASSGQNPVSSASYFPSQQVRTATFGSGDSDTYALDTNLRLSSYTLDINGSNDTGTLVWNGNNTLKSLATSDPFATGDTQTCSYTQDDLGRLASANCGSEWAQTYTPDSFGNQSTTSGGSNPLVANFNGNNQFSSVSGFAPTYDLDGDLLDNPLSQTRNAYAWDAEGHAVTVEGVAQTFDALGRLVQNSRAGEALWTPAGAKLGTMNGQSAGQEAAALPGHGAAVYAGGALSFCAHAGWQGSRRLASTPSRTFDGDEAYSPHGATYAGAGPAAFTGKQVDTPDALYDFPFRFSSPGLKRWLSPDPASLAAVNPADPESWNQYAYANNTPLSLIDPLGLAVCRPTVKLHLPNDNKSDEASGEFGPYQPQGDSAAGEQAADPPGYSGCAGPGDSWDTFSIDGADVGGLGMSMDLGFGGPDGTGAGIGGFSDCPTFACSPTVTGHDGLVHALNYGYTPLYGASTSIQFSWGTDMSATVFGTLGWSVGPPQSSFSFLPLLAPASSAGPGGGLLGSNGAAIANLGRGLATVTHPFEFLLADEFIGATGVLTVGAGAAVIGFGCGAPGVDLLTCIPALGAGVPIITLGVGEAGLAGYLFWSKTLPAFRSWGQE